MVYEFKSDESTAASHLQLVGEVGAPDHSSNHTNTNYQGDFPTIQNSLKTEDNDNQSKEEERKKNRLFSEHIVKHTYSIGEK
jgi:hypothetical protein